ncbi:hypothetical protein GGD62_005786 [Bradyrhizobium sp. ERR14]|nr:hypothetical protein [Bradyrhizobium sp. ERR14]
MRHAPRRCSAYKSGQLGKEADYIADISLSGAQLSCQRVSILTQLCRWSVKTLSHSSGPPVVRKPIRQNYTNYLNYLLLTALALP